jgi:uncharacterized protein YgiM (DUF1202 family)
MFLLCNMKTNAGEIYKSTPQINKGEQLEMEEQRD